MRYLIFSLLFFSIANSALAQSDTVLVNPVPKPFYKPHIIKFNPTPFLVWSSKSLMFSYEQVVKPYQSFSVSAGLLSIPGLIRERSADTAVFEFSRAKSSGYSIVVDYRFYMKKENKGFAPHGLYIAPYVSHHNHWWDSRLDLVLANGDFVGADISSQLFTIGIGGQIGYQFSFFDDRFTVDLITFAPSFSFYRFSLKADSDNSFDFEEYYPKMAEWLLDKYPWLSGLTQDELIDFSGTTNTANLGARFVVQLGYRF